MWRNLPCRTSNATIVSCIFRPKRDSRVVVVLCSRVLFLKKDIARIGRRLFIPENRFLMKRTIFIFILLLLWLCGSVFGQTKEEPSSGTWKAGVARIRSEERRVGKERRYRGRRDQWKQQRQVMESSEGRCRKKE